MDYISDACGVRFTSGKRPLMFPTTMLLTSDRSLEVNSEVSENSSAPSDSEASVSMVCNVRVVNVIGNINCCARTLT